MKHIRTFATGSFKKMPWMALAASAAAFTAGGIALVMAMPASTLLPVSAPAGAKLDQLWNQIETSEYTDQEGLPTEIGRAHV